MPFLTGFGKRKEIKYGTVFPGANLTDFPKLFVIAADADIAAELSGGGGIAVTSDDETTEVPFGLYPSSDPTSGDLILRAKFPTLLTAASTGDTLGYLYYDAGETTTEDKAGVVSADYEAYMPLEEDPSGSAPQMFDWVSETNIGTSVGTMTSGDLVAAQVGNGLDFDGSDDRIDTTLALNGTTVYTVEVICDWPNTHTPVAIGIGNYALRARDGATPFGWQRNTGGFETVVSGTTAPTAGNRYQVAVSVNGTGATAARIYENGVDTTASQAAGNALDTTVLTLAHPVFVTRFGGIIDEVRVSSVVRSAAWLEYQYADDFDNADTFSLGAEEEDGGGFVAFPYPRGLYGGAAMTDGGVSR